FAFLAELKRSGVRPDQLAHVVGQRFAGRLDDAGLGLKARQCLLIYSEYQERLIRHNLYDLEGRFWYARDLLGQGPRRPFENVRAVFVDGFTDFTRVQHEILAAFAANVDEVWIALPDEPRDDRAELFSRPRHTRARFQALHLPVELVECAPRSADTSPPGAVGEVPAGLAHLERQLFRPLRSVLQAADADGLR